MSWGGRGLEEVEEGGRVDGGWGGWEDGCGGEGEEAGGGKAEITWRVVFMPFLVEVEVMVAGIPLPLRLR